MLQREVITPHSEMNNNYKNTLWSLINVLYVNKQEFSASSWRSNQGYNYIYFHTKYGLSIWSEHNYKYFHTK